METVPFSLASQLIGVPRNFEELSFNMTPNFELTPAQMDQRDGNELRQLILMQQTRKNMEMTHREQRIQRLQREERQREIEREREVMLSFLEEIEEAIQ
jgi:Na+/phosphate symporter